MLDLLDQMIRQILLEGVAGLEPVASNKPPAPVSDAQVGFGPPDQNWRNYVRGLQRNALNVYLVDVRENRKLRSNERARELVNGMVVSTPAPMRLDCHYLITAWSPAEISDQVEPTLDEHQLLYQATAALMDAAPFNPSRVYVARSTAPGWPDPFWDTDLPVDLAPVEGFPKYAEFWGTMGNTHPWKPAVYLIVTVPVEMLKVTVGPAVTTTITDYGVIGQNGASEVRIQIGGTVLDGRKSTAQRPVPLVGIWVQLRDATNQPIQSSRTDPDGHFTFLDLEPGQYVLEARATGFTPHLRQVDVPSPTGDYDLSLT